MQAKWKEGLHCKRGGSRIVLREMSRGLAVSVGQGQHCCCVLCKARNSILGGELGVAGPSAGEGWQLLILKCGFWHYIGASFWVGGSVVAEQIRYWWGTISRTFAGYDLELLACICHE